MTESIAALFCVVLIVFVLSAVIAYTVRRLSLRAPGRLAAVIVAIAAFAGVVPAVIRAASDAGSSTRSTDPPMPGEASGPPFAVWPTASVVPSVPGVVHDSGPLGPRLP
jgi:predicted PurR-regulated permease PerM